MCAEAIAWQKWLVHIAVQVALTRKEEQQNDNPNGRNNQYCENHCPQCIPSIVDITPEHPISVFKFYLPKWSWDNEDYSFEWSTEFPNDLRPSSWASISQTNWELAIRFFRTLQWEIDDSLSFAYIELAYHFHDCGYSFHDIENSPSNVSSLLRNVMNQAIKIGSQFPLVVGTQKAAPPFQEGKHGFGRLFSRKPTSYEGIQALKRLVFFVWLQGKINMANRLLERFRILSCGFHLWLFGGWCFTF